MGRQPLSVRHFAIVLVVSVAATITASVGNPRPVAATTGGWEQEPTMSFTSRSYQAMAYDPGSDEVIMFGGRSWDGAYLNDTWVWDGTSWESRGRELAIPARRGAAMAHHATTGLTVLFGGETIGGTLLDDTWMWDGSAWTRVTASGPSARRGATMAYDDVTDELVLFGGTGILGDLSDTWRYDPVSRRWMQVQTTRAPSSRTDATSAENVVGGVVLFGGETSAGTKRGDTWVWDGTTWLSKSPVNSPTPRAGAVAAENNTTGTVLLFGGKQAGGCDVFSDETWSWDGTDWQRQASGSTPPARAYAGAAYHDGAGAFLVVGGHHCVPGEYSGNINDVWTWRGGLAPVTTEPSEPEPACSADESGVPYVTGGGSNQVLDIYEHRDGSTDPRPAVLLVHQGAWVGGGYATSWKSLPCDLADAGFVTFNMEYRYNEEHRWLNQPADVDAALRYVQQRTDLAVDPARVALWGSSAGAHLSLLEATVSPERPGEHGKPRAVISWSGPSDLYALAAHYGCTNLRCSKSNPSQWVGWAVQTFFDGCLADEPAPGQQLWWGWTPSQCSDTRYSDTSAVNVTSYAGGVASGHVDNLDPPTQIVHHLGDPVVPYEQAQYVHNALAEAGVPVELKTVDGVGHGVADLYPSYADDGIDFLTAHLCEGKC